MFKSPGSITHVQIFDSYGNYYFKKVNNNFNDTLPHFDIEGRDLKNGTHWVAWYKNGKTKIYFDSYGVQPPIEVIYYLGKPIHYNTDQVQPAGEVFCGHLCLYVLKELSMGNEFQKVLNKLFWYIKMPVDKFGRMSDAKTRDTGVSLTYINNNYIRSDGGTPVSGSIDMRGNTLYNVSDPVNP